MRRDKSVKKRNGHKPTKLYVPIPMNLKDFVLLESGLAAEPAAADLPIDEGNPAMEEPGLQEPDSAGDAAMIPNGAPWLSPFVTQIGRAERSLDEGEGDLKERIEEPYPPSESGKEETAAADGKERTAGEREMAIAREQATACVEEGIKDAAKGTEVAKIKDELPSADRSIAIVTPGKFPIPSGRSSSVELVAVHVSEQLKRQTNMRLYIFGLRKEKQPPEQTIDGIVYSRFPREGYIRHVLRRLKALKPALIQVENRPRYASFLKRKLRRYPVLLSLHSTTFISRPHIGKKRLLPCLRAVDAILVNSRYLQEMLVKLDPKLSGKIVVNHLGVDPFRFPSRWSKEHKEIREQDLESLGWAGCSVIAFIGRFIPIKGVHHILKAMPAVLEKQPNARLLLVGGAFYGKNAATPYVERLKRLAKPLGDKVRFIPYVTHEQIGEWFRLADLVVVPSTAREAFGLVNVEAMASGVPVIATSAGGMREVIEHGRTGLLVPLPKLEQELPKRISELLLRPEYAQALGEQGRLRVLEHFTWSHTAERLAELYRRL